MLAASVIPNAPRAVLPEGDRLALIEYLRGL
jgi:hypothetical protein